MRSLCLLLFVRFPFVPALSFSRFFDWRNFVSFLFSHLHFKEQHQPKKKKDNKALEKKKHELITTTVKRNEQFLLLLLFFILAKCFDYFVALYFELLCGCCYVVVVDDVAVPEIETVGTHAYTRTHAHLHTHV